jgi:peptidoglycan/xylan/chitin deacetylase (PgdA/CDA1 family)
VSVERRRRTALGIAATAIFAVIVFYAYEWAESPASQLFGPTLVSGPANEHVIALTFDDGPNPPYTNEILELLERENVHATFFVVGRAVSAYPQTVRREASDGDAIGNHTWNHAHLIVLDAAHIDRSLERTDAAVEKAAGVKPEIMRPPFGARDWLVLQEARRLGYVPVMWSVPLARDWNDPEPETIAHRILRYARNGSIIVLHDGNRGMLCAQVHPEASPCNRQSTVAATKLIIDSLKKKGYRFVTIPQLLRSISERSDVRVL